MTTFRTITLLDRVEQLEEAEAERFERENTRFECAYCTEIATVLVGQENSRARAACCWLHGQPKPGEVVEPIKETASREIAIAVRARKRAKKEVAR